MNKNIIIWGKRVCRIIGVVLILLSVFYIGKYVYEEYYIPYREDSICNSLYKKGLKSSNNKEIDSIAIELKRYSIDKAVEVLRRSAKLGRASSQVLLADMYDEESKDATRASYWYLQAAKKGNAEAQRKLGNNFFYGNGVKQDFKKGIYWISLGANNGDSEAQCDLGYLYLNGVALYNIGYFHQNYRYSGGLTFRKIGEDNCIVKESQLSSILEHPTIVYLKSDIAKAKYYWTLAAKQNNEDAISALEKIY